MIYALSGERPEIAAGVYLAPDAVVIGRVAIGEGSSIWFGTVLRGDVDRIAIGRETNIQDLSMVHCDAGIPTVVGDRVTVGHRAILHGCRVEDECIVGMGAIVQNRAVIRRQVVVASGSVVREGFEAPAGTLVAGVPAVVKRELTGQEVEGIRRLAAVYAERAKLYSTAVVEAPRPEA